MKLKFNHTGRQFFFITLVLEGREKILSRLVDCRSRPILTKHGETVKAALVALHGEFPCVTVSDFAIMPDHLHFVMIVDYSRAPSFSPLWAAHRLMDATEAIWEADGDSAPEPPEALHRAVILARQNAGRLTIAATPHLRRPAPGTVPVGVAPLLGRGSGVQPPSIPKWNRRCYIELSFDSRQLKTIRRYIRLNPARALWKAAHPDRFIRFTNIRHPVLDPARRWDAMGNLTLLASPFLRHARLTMRKTVDDHLPEITDIIGKTRAGLVPVSGFISPGEKELLRRLKETPHARFVKTVPFALPPRYDPSAEDSRELAADRMLILSGFPQGTADSRENLRARCLVMNDLAAGMCEKARTLGGTP